VRTRIDAGEGLDYGEASVLLDAYDRLALTAERRAALIDTMCQTGDLLDALERLTADMRRGLAIHALTRSKLTTSMLYQSIRERHRSGSLEYANDDRGVLLAEVDRLREKVGELEGRRTP
jgi:polyhydroxyalkanoate synthesis regulator phasin